MKKIFNFFWEGVKFTFSKESEFFMSSRRRYSGEY